MDHTATPWTSAEVLSMMKPAIAPADAINKVLAGAMGKMQKIQSDSCAAIFGDSMLYFVPAFLPGGTSRSIWQFPTWYQTQTDRAVQSLLDALNVLHQSQQTMLEMMAGSLRNFAEQAAETISQLNTAFFSRRVSAELINFSDRRANGKAASEAEHDPVPESASRRRSARKSTG